MKKSFLVSTLLFLFCMREAISQTKFIWPVRAVNNYSEVNEFYVINNYVDQDMTSGVQDWNCRTRTYDGHQGIDIDLWPFTWSMMDNNYVMAVAAAPGRIVVVSDNNNNESNCKMPGENTVGNYIAVRHADSSTSFYIHIRDNSAMVTVGQMVREGQPLAFVGSSGSSSNPHLHFEVNSRPVNKWQVTGLIDPYNGTCNSLNTISWWQSQKPYFEPAIMRVMTHGSRPALLGYANNYNPGFCRSAEIKNAKAAFFPNDSIYVGVGMRDFMESNNHSFNMKVYYPDGSVWLDENKSSNYDTTFRRVYYTFDKKISSNAPSGTYKVVVSFNGTSDTYFFTVNCPANDIITGTKTGYNGAKAAVNLTATTFIPAGSRMLLQAGTKIILAPGFRAENGSRLKARIRDCNYSE